MHVFPVDVLNRMCPSYPQKDNLNSKVTFDLDNARENGERSRRLAKYIFARQYNLNSPFYTKATKSSPFSFGDYMDREAEIKVSR